MISLADFERFITFARVRLAEVSSVCEVARQWEEQIDYDETVAFAKRGIANEEAGHVTTADEVVSVICRVLDKRSKL